MAVNLLDRRPQHQSLAKRFIALLTFDSRSQAPAFGVRSSSTTSGQLLYSIGDGELDLRVTEQDGRWVLTGQVLGFEECLSGNIALVGEGTSASTVLNDLCEFKLAPVPAGNYRMTLQFGDVEVEVPRLELK